jgi:hypothetical protein
MVRKVQDAEVLDDREMKLREAQGVSQIQHTEHNKSMDKLKIARVPAAAGYHEKGLILNNKNQGV